MLVAVLLVVGCADNSYHGAEIGTVWFERLPETGEIEFDLTYLRPSP